MKKIEDPNITPEPGSQEPSQPSQPAGKTTKKSDSKDYGKVKNLVVKISGAKTKIGYGSVVEGSEKAHGSPLKSENTEKMDGNIRISPLGKYNLREQIPPLVRNTSPPRHPPSD